MSTPQLWSQAHCARPLKRYSLTRQRSLRSHNRKGKAMITDRQNAKNHTIYKRGSSLRIMWVIAWRQITEAIRERSTLIMMGSSVGLPLIILFFALTSALQIPSVGGSTI